MSADDAEWGAFLQSTALAMLEAADEGLIVFDSGGFCRMMGRRVGEIFGVSPSALVGRSRQEVLSALASACEEPDAFLPAAGMNGPLGAPPVVADLDILRPRPRSVVCKAVPISREGKAPGRLLVLRDVTRERSAERTSAQLRARLDELTPFDPLTALLNARRFREELEREHGRSARAWDSYGVLRLDVDGMKAYNDEFGMPVGDAILERVADRLKGCLREYDVLARLEGDEFGVLLPGADSVAARAVAERMRLSVDAVTHEALGDRKVTLSIGGALWVPPSGEAQSDILRRAGENLNTARARGQAQVHIGDSLAHAP